MPVELGAEFMHTAANPLRPVLRAAGFEERRGVSSHLPSESFRPRLESFLAASCTPEESISVEALVQRHATDAPAAQLLEEAFGAQRGREELRRTSATDAMHELELELADDEFMGEHNFRLPAGWGTVVDHLAQGLHCETGRRVEHIGIEAGGIVVEAVGENGPLQYRAEQLIVTVPLGVLKNGDIQFTPALPAEKSAAIQAMTTLDILKLVFVFDGDVWTFDSPVQQTRPSPSTWWHSTWDGAPRDETVIVGWAVGDEARRMLQEPPEVMTARAAASLSAMLGRPDHPPRTATFHSWGADPFTRGSYSHVPPGAPRDIRDRLAMPTGDRIFWAGEATAAFRSRTVGGAYASGARAAAEVLDARSRLVEAAS
ncbi:hypothetical protein ASE14_09795 [Agromyces sp. Root81]|nr:hypothetical protein ASE14_09795 [Agromyces sp. Root81]